MFIKCFTHIMVAMATYFFQNVCEKGKIFKSSPFYKIIFKNQIKPIFAYYFKARIKQNISGMFKKCFTHIIMVAMATYPPIPPIFVKNEIVQIKPIFFIIIFKARIKKKIKNVI